MNSLSQRVSKSKNVCAFAAAPGRPKQGSAPSGGSAVHEVTNVGAGFSEGPLPRENAAPSGGSAVHEVTNVGAIFSVTQQVVEARFGSGLGVNAFHDDGSVKVVFATVFGQTAADDD